MKKKNLYLHIGTHKTGSTSIQYLLKENSEKLKSEDYYYPMEGSYFYPPEASQSLLAHAILGNKPAYIGRTVIEYDSCISDVKRDIESSHCSNVIISSEHFSHAMTLEAVQKIHDLFVNLFDKITVIVYLRRQDNRIESAWGQAVKTSQSTLSFNDFYNKNISLPRWDYFSLLKNWIDIFGENFVKIRPFEKFQFFKNNLLDDFLNLIDSKLQPTNSVVRNLSPSAEFLEIMRCFTNSNIEYGTRVNLAKMINSFGVKIDQTKYTFMLPEQRKLTLEMCRESNINVARQYLKRSDGILFRDSEISDLPVYPGLNLQRFSNISHQIIVALIRAANQSSDNITLINEGKFIVK